jgi:hypothetical protein
VDDTRSVNWRTRYRLHEFFDFKSYAFKLPPTWRSTRPADLQFVVISGAKDLLYLSAVRKCTGPSLRSGRWPPEGVEFFPKVAEASLVQHPTGIAIMKR